MRTHYDNLRITRESTPAQIRSAYRKLVLQHHPDKSTKPESKAIFLAAKEAYETLSDPMKKRSYDASMDVLTPPKPDPKPKPNPEPKPQAQAPKPADPPRPKTQDPRPTIPQLLAQLQTLFGQGRYSDAEKLANDILAQSSREAVPYAVLGDIARSQGNLNEAARLYAYAAQFAPTNPIYQRRYEELLDRSAVKTTHGNIRIEAQDTRFVAPIFGGGIVMATATYLLFSNEAPIAHGITPISTWTLGLIVMLFLAGIAVGATFSIGNLLERFSMAVSPTVGRIGSTVVIGLIAALNFWLAALVYVAMGTFKRAFNVTTSRFVGGITAATLLLFLAASCAKNLAGFEVLLWGGNVIYIGAICGWMVADAFRG